MSRRRYIKGTLRKSDFNRAVLTDTAPYELPIAISNDGFYKNLKDAASSSQPLREVIDALIVENTCHYTKPYRYNISSGTSSVRRLSLLHPHAQYQTALFYEKYDTLICYYCQPGEASLRRPLKIGSSFFFKTELADLNKYRNNRIDTTDIDNLVRNPASYFAYSGIDRLYKFFKSKSFLSMERKFSLMRLMDISKCFDSIYTHSINWLITSPQHSKDNNQARSFGNDFDALMTKMNYNETNGICIGPELSRIFAEIILCAVDARVAAAAKSENFVEGRDFAYRRYVDDFIMFANDPRTMDRISEIIGDELAHFKLHINGAKTLDHKRPFATPKSQTVTNANVRLGTFFDGLMEAVRPGLYGPRKIYRPDAVVRSLVGSIRSGCYQEGVGYELVANYVIASLVKRMNRIIDGFPEATGDFGVPRSNYAPVLMRLMEGAFFFYNVHPTVASSFHLGQGLLVLWRFVDKSLPEEALSVAGQLQLWVSQLLNRQDFQTRLSTTGRIPVEFLNVILAAVEVDGVNQFDETILRTSVFHTAREEYFSIVSCLFYIRDQAIYRQLRNETENCILRLLAGCSNVQKSAHDAHLALDAICCPYLSIAMRTRVLRDLRAALNLAARSQADLEVDVAEMQGKPWFVQWDRVDVLRLIKKKELSSVY